MTRRLGLIVAGFLAVAGPAFAQAPLPPDAKVGAIMNSAKYKEAIAHLSGDHDRIVQENIALAEIPAPPFKEEAKAKALLEMLKQYQLTDVHMDAEGNVLGLRKGRGNGPLLAVVAHIDTVFPEGTDVKVKRDGDILRGPGISDDTRGLAVVLAMIRGMEAAKIETDSDILFVGSVGEEGLGDLRGVKYLLLKGPYKDRIKRFIAVDGSVHTKVGTTSVGSRRYRLAFTGPGGHSYRAFGSVNPMYAMGNFLTEFATTKVPEQTTYGVGVLGGGTSVNSIPVDAWVEIDMRSVSPDELSKLENRMKTIAAAAAETENKARSTRNGKIEFKLTLVGDRPAGSVSHPLLGSNLPPGARATVSENTELAAYAWESVKAHGVKPDLDAGSTDANVAMNLGIPSVSIAPGLGDRNHSLDEWLNVGKDVSMRQLGIVLTTVLATAGMRQ